MVERLPEAQGAHPGPGPHRAAALDPLLRGRGLRRGQAAAEAGRASEQGAIPPLATPAIRWGYELLPEAEQAGLTKAIAVIDQAIRGEPVEQAFLDAAVAQVATVVARHRPRDL